MKSYPLKNFNTRTEYAISLGLQPLKIIRYNCATEHVRRWAPSNHVTFIQRQFKIKNIANSFLKD